MTKWFDLLKLPRVSCSGQTACGTSERLTLTQQVNSVSFQRLQLWCIALHESLLRFRTICQQLKLLRGWLLAGPI